MSVRAILRAGGGTTSGQKRKLIAKQIDDALFSLWQAAHAAQGAEYAACVLTHVISKDPTYAPELWVVQTLKRHRRAIEAAFRPNQANPY